MVRLERFKCTILNDLRHFFSDNSRDYNPFSHAMKLDYKNTVHRAAGLTVLDIFLMRPSKRLNMENITKIND